MMSASHPFVQELYTALGPWAEYDESGDLLTYVRAVASMFEEVYELARDDGDTPGWSKLFDPTDADSNRLAFMGQFVGVELGDGLTLEQQRERVRATGGFYRGTLQAIIDAARQTLTGDKRVIVSERDTSPYHFTVRTFASETPNPALTLAVLTALKPAGLIMVHQVSAGMTYAELDTMYGTYADQDAAYNTYAEQTLDEP